MSNIEVIEGQWNTIFIDFLDQMNGLFPDSPAEVLKTKMKLNNLIGGEKPIKMFTDTIKGHEDEIVNKNDTYFFSGNRDIAFVKDLELDKYYKMASTKNKGIIWSFITILYQLSDAYMKKLNV